MGQEITDFGLKRTQSAGAHAHEIPFIANLHITETRSILFLTKYDKKNYRINKSTLKNRFFSKRMKFKQNTAKIETEL